MTPAERTVRAHTTLMLWMIVSAAPDKNGRLLWNALEHAAAAELDRRLAPGVAA